MQQVSEYCKNPNITLYVHSTRWQLYQPHAQRTYCALHALDMISSGYERLVARRAAVCSGARMCGQATMEVGMKKFFCGPESFTPDLQPIVGEAPELQNYFVAACVC